MKSRLLFFLILNLLLLSCNSFKRNARVNKTEIKKSIDATFILHHLNDSISELHYLFKNKNINYFQNDSGSIYEFRLLCFYLVSNQNMIITDTGNFVITDKQHLPLSKEIEGHQRLHVSKMGRFIHLSIQSPNDKLFSEYKFEVFKESVSNEQNWMIKKKQGNVIFGNVVSIQDTLRISIPRAIQNKIYLSRLKAIPDLPPPPFSIVDETAQEVISDSNFTCNLNEQLAFIRFNQKTAYFLKTDSLSLQGKLIIGTSPSFPEIESYDDMVACTRFVLNKDEFLKIKSSPDQRKAIEDFWLKVAGNKERAKELIKKFYGRVSFANLNYTSFKEGWKTDRGMIYIIFGKPESIYKSEEQETWVYGNENSPNAIYFRFKQKPSIYTKNNWVLIRNPDYKNAWYIAVNNWREGRVFLDN